MRFKNFSLKKPGINFPHSARAKKKVWYALGAFILLLFLWGISALGAFRPFLFNIPQITGWPGTERTYLLLFQNNTELRPTGGFITAYALLNFKNGIPSGLSFYDVYSQIDDHPYVSPPYPLDVLLEKDSKTYNGHSFRDANFNPDFTVAKDDILQFFHLTYPDINPNGMFAINFSVLEDLVNLYGPFKIGKQELTKENLFESLENNVSDIDRHNVNALNTRKDIIKEFGQIVLRKMVLNPWKWRSLSELLVQELNHKDILLVFENKFLAKKIAQKNWDGHWPINDARHKIDRLIVNIANYGGMKSDRYLTHEVHYTIEITNRKDQDGKPLVYGDLEINLRHLGGYNTPLSGDYTGYLRVFLPPGTSLIESLSGQSGDVSLNGYAGWGDFITLHPGEQQTFKYRFKLNADYFLNDAYVLNIIKQPGTLNDFYDVNIKAPLGKKISGNQWENHENVAFYRGFLNQDLELELKFSEDEFGPRLFDQKNAALNIITLSFAESLDTSGATDPLNYQIADLDVNEPGITDSLIIDFIEVDEGTIRIYTKGMTIQPEEHFSVSMRNIRDRNGNYINPNPRAVTVVQRLE